MVWEWLDGDEKLEGGGVTLEILGRRHEAALSAAAEQAEPEEWAMGYVPHPADIKDYISLAEADLLAGRGHPFAVRLTDGEVIGASWFRTFDPWRKRIEIGLSWYALPHRRGFVNLQTKMLMLGFAFEKLGCELVEFLIHEHNRPARRAVAGLGAREDGMLRQTIPMSDGCFDAAVVFSISRAEWPAVQMVIDQRLEARRTVLHPML